MTQNFASLALARLYEKQGYTKDALEMYQALDVSCYPDAEDIEGSIARLQAIETQAPLNTVAQETQGVSNNEPPKKDFHQSGSDVASSDMTGVSKEEGMSLLLEKWLMLMIMQKRVDVFKDIKSRL